MNTTNINDIASGVIDLTKVSTPKIATIPAPLVANAVNLRNGLSADSMLQELLLKYRQIGIPTGTLEDGSLAVNEAAMLALFQVIVRNIQENAKIQVSAFPAAVTVQVTGTDATGTPFVGTGANTNFIIASGVIV